jgi:hypothetical protein
MDFPVTAAVAGAPKRYAKVAGCVSNQRNGVIFARPIMTAKYSWHPTNNT